MYPEEGTRMVVDALSRYQSRREQLIRGGASKAVRSS